MNDRRLAQNIICATLSLLMIAGLSYMYYTDQMIEDEFTATAESLLEEAEQYENELRKLELELSSLESIVSYSSDEAEIMVGFNISDVSDLSYIEEKAETYGFYPVLVINCTINLEIIKRIIDEADKALEIMLYTDSSIDEVNDDILSVIAYLEAEGRDYSGVFLLRDAYSSTTNIKVLIDDGFIGYTNYNDEALNVGQTEDGMIYFEYHYLSTEDTDISERLSYLYSRKSSMIVVFDMSSINSGSLSESYVISLLDLMQNYADGYNCSFSTVANVVEELSKINAIESANQEEYEKEVQELQDKIDELKAYISEIYSRLN